MDINTYLIVVSSQSDTDTNSLYCVLTCRMQSFLSFPSPWTALRLLHQIMTIYAYLSITNYIHKRLGKWPFL